MTMKRSSVRLSIGLRLNHFLCRLSPTLCTRYLYWRQFHRRLCLDQPTTLNEKILWLKLHTYRDNALVTQCADKYGVREYVAQAGCGELLNECYGVWESPEQVDWDALPERFAIKCNHGCGYNLLCSDKAAWDIHAAREQLRCWLDEEYWLHYAELQYRNIPHRILAERYLGDGTQAPTDYKIYCFHGEPLYILVCLEREKGKPKFYFFDYAWNFCPITRDGQAAPAGFTLPRPDRLEDMLEHAQRLAAPFPFVRVDMYDINNQLVFGELTFTPSGGLDTARLPETDRMFGELLRLATDGR